MDKNALVKPEPPAPLGRASMWHWYKTRTPAVRIAIPFGLALACISGGWVVLNEGEYGVALALVCLFLLFAIQMARETAWSRRAKQIAGFTFIVIAIYSGAVIISKRGDKPWTTLLAQKKEETTRESVEREII